MSRSAKVNRNIFTRKVYKFLKENHTIKTSKSKIYDGWIIRDCHPTILFLNLSADVVPTLIHEILHYYYPDASERWVEKESNLIVQSLTSKQIRNIYCKLAEYI